MLAVEFCNAALFFSRRHLVVVASSSPFNLREGNRDQTFPDLVAPIVSYLRERFGKVESAIPQLPQIGQGMAMQPLPAIGESSITQFENGPCSCTSCRLR
jgi:hypothetical protein